MQVPFEIYATADDNVETSERLSEADTVDVVRKWHNPDADDEDGEDLDSDDDAEVVDSSADSTVAADESKIIASSNQFLHTISQQKAYVLCHKLPDAALDALNSVQQIVIDFRLSTCKKQTNLLAYFNH